MARTQAGNSFMELLVSLSIMGMTAMIALPALLNSLGRAALHASAARIEQIFVATQFDAIGHDCSIGVKFYQSGDRWLYGIYEDGNGNGIRNDEIVSGVDRRVEGPYDLFAPGSPATIGFPAGGVEDPDGAGTLAFPALPVNFNQSTICSFSRSGTSTPGSIYLTDGTRAAMVRASGSSGRVRIVYYEGGKWQL